MMCSMKQRIRLIFNRFIVPFVHLGPFLRDWLTNLPVKYISNATQLHCLLHTSTLETTRVCRTNTAEDVLIFGQKNFVVF